MDIVELKIEPACVTDSIASTIAAPKGCCRRTTVGANQMLTIGLVLIERWTSRARLGPSGAIAVSITGTRTCTLTIVVLVLAISCFICGAGRLSFGAWSRARGTVTLLQFIYLLASCLALFRPHIPFEPRRPGQVSGFEIKTWRIRCRQG